MIYLAVQLFTIAFLACIWDEGAWLARSDEGSMARARVIGCQILVVAIPVILGGLYSLSAQRFGRIPDFAYSQDLCCRFYHSF